VSTLVFQRQRVDGENAWCWPDASDPVDFDVSLLKEGTEPDRVALVINVSGTIGSDELPEEQRAVCSIYSITPSLPAEPSPTVVSSPATLSRFEHAVRNFLGRLESSHGKIPHVDVFAAVPVSAAVSVGRTLMPNISPALRVFDRGEDGRFFEAIEVQR
jgi:SMODS-associated and fused to various effectors sensor domain